MKISVNGEERQIAADASIEQLLCALELADTRGLAVALNSAVVRRTEWSTRQLHDGDVVLLIQAAQGG